MSERMRGRRRTRKYGEIRQNEKFAIRECDATRDNRILGVGYETVPLAGVKVSAATGVTKKKDGNESNSGIWDEESVVESKASRGRDNDDGADAKSINRGATKSFNGMGRDGTKRLEVGEKRGNVARSARVDDERKVGGGERNVRGRDKSRFRRRNSKRGRKRHQRKVKRGRTKGINGKGQIDLMELVIVQVWGGQDFRNMR